VTAARAWRAQQNDDVTGPSRRANSGQGRRAGRYGVCRPPLPARGPRAADRDVQCRRSGPGRCHLERGARASAADARARLPVPICSPRRPRPPRTYRSSVQVHQLLAPVRLEVPLARVLLARVHRGSRRSCSPSRWSCCLAVWSCSQSRASAWMSRRSGAGSTAREFIRRIFPSGAQRNTRRSALAASRRSTAHRSMHHPADDVTDARPLARELRTRPGRRHDLIYSGERSWIEGCPSPPTSSISCATPPCA